MKKNRPSATSSLVARGLLLVAETPEWAPVLIAGSVARTKEFLTPAEGSHWLDVVQETHLGRAVLRRLERILSPGILLHWALRKRVFDAVAQNALEAGCEQVVILGAGLDTLGWRLCNRVMCFELDHPATQALKRNLPSAGPHLIAIDLGQVSAAQALLAHSAFRANSRTLFVAEGLLMYLPPDRVAGLFRELAQVAAPGSRIVFSFMEDRPGFPLSFHNASGWIGKWLSRKQEPFLWGLQPSAVPAFLQQDGWEMDALTTTADFRQLLAPFGLEKEPLAIGEPVVTAHTPLQ